MDDNIYNPLLILYSNRVWKQT